MSDTEDTTPASDTPRDGTGRYVSGRQDGKSGDAAGSGGNPPPAGDDAEAGKDDEREGRKRWLLLLLLLLILLLLLCAGFVYMKWFKKDPGTTTPTPSPTAITQTSEAPKPSPTPTVVPSPTPTVKTVAMPDVVNKPASEAKTILEAAGFTNIKFVDEANGNSLSLIVSYVVTKQSVPPGTQVPVDTALTITAKTSSSGKG